MAYLATDVGGTFTDLIYYDDATGVVSSTKTLTTPDNPALGVMRAIEIGCGDGFLDPVRTKLFVHGGTTVINAITERKGVKTALVTTAGFRDVLEIGRGNRPDLYNLHAVSPTAFVPRRLRFEVRERVDAKGRVLVPIALEDLDAIIAAVERENVAAIAVVFLHSYAHPQHEIACARVLRERLPKVAVTASHEISRQWREFERTNTTVLNAYVTPVVDRYFTDLASALEQRGFAQPFYVMQSNGGTTSFEAAKQHPLSLVESGPAGGVNGAAQVGAVCGDDDLLYLDVGGTTAKCCVIQDGRPQLTTEYRLERSRTHPGYPVQLPVVDIVEIGAGGGSIAWFDAGGSLRVGPQSAGAKPGPACYGFGGEAPTVTDAKLICGVLNPDSFAAGSLRLDLDRARRVMDKVAGPLELDTIDAARAVIKLAEASMINALKLVTIQRGHDPRELTLIASGGGGPMHAARLTRDLGVRRVVIPPYPGLFSAWGMLAAPPRRDLQRTALMPADANAIAIGKELFAAMREECTAYFGVEQQRALEFAYSIDMRYRGQEHTVSVACDPSRWDERVLLEAFHQAHQRAYTFRLDRTQAEVVTFHVKAELQSPRPGLAKLRPSAATASPLGTRTVHFDDVSEPNCPVYARSALPAGFVLTGPALIEEPSSTTVVLPGQRMSVNDYGLLVIEADRENGEQS